MEILNLSPRQVKDLIDSGVTYRLIDVREKWEYELCNLPQSELMPLGSLPNFISGIDKEENLIIYCHHGIRSMNAALYLKECGFTNLINLSGGIDGWSDEVDNSIPKY